MLVAVEMKSTRNEEIGWMRRREEKKVILYDKIGNSTLGLGLCQIIKD